MARTDEELQRASELWYQVGIYDTVLPVEDIKCHGCESRTGCTLGIKECHKQRGVKKCNLCPEFPCEIIDSMLQQIENNKKKWKEVCTDSEYALICKAFFEKEANLRK